MYRVLIVEGDEKQREDLKTMIDWVSFGFSAQITAATYTEAVDKALDLNPHIALIDIHLGEHWGFELAEHLRAAGLKTVFCMMADNQEPQLMRWAMQVTAQEWLVRPLEPRQLQAFVERVVVNDLHGSIHDVDAPRREMDPVLQVPYASLSKITSKIIMVVRSGYRQSLTLTFIAETFNMSGKYIGRVFLKETGMKFSEYLMAYRMLEARRLVMNTQEKISSIANMVGYAQLNNFYIHFKTYFGVSPSALRNFEDPGKGDPL